MNTARRSKIARLPKSIREELNRRLEDAEPGSQLVQWLNQLPPVQSLLAAEFDGQPITTQNLSHWRRHGHRDWLRQQQTVEVVRNLSADSKELLKAAHDKSLTDQIAVALAARFAVIAQELAAQKSNPDNWRRLRELTRDVVALRRGDHTSRRLKMEETLFDAESEDQDDAIVERFKKWAKYGRVREWLEQQDADKKERERRLRIFLGFDEDVPEPPTAAEIAHKQKMDEKRREIRRAAGLDDSVSPSRNWPSAFHPAANESTATPLPSAPETDDCSPLTAHSSPPAPTTNEQTSASHAAPPLPRGAGRGEGINSSSPTTQKTELPVIDRTSAKAAAAMKDSERFLTPIRRLD